MAVGMPTTKPQIKTRPMLALRVSTATTGPGCGGIRPCITERQEIRGSISNRNGCFVSRVSVSKIGSSNMSPTANQVVRPTARARAMMHHWMCFGPKNAANRLASTSAPPDSASSLPSIVPRPRTAAMPPRVVPTPSWMDLVTPSIV